jgi:hypothetical protein
VCLIRARREWWLFVEEGGLNLMDVGGGTKKGTKEIHEQEGKKKNPHR